MSAHPAFVEEMHRRLVVPRRNTGRALRALKDGDMEMLKHYLIELDEQIDALYCLSVNEEGRNVETCNLGHTHYVQATS